MNDTIPGKQSEIQRLRKLLFLRVIVTTFLLGIAAFIQIKGSTQLPEGFLFNIYTIIIVTYVLSIWYSLLQRWVRRIRTNIYIQAFCDVVVITVLVYVTGGVYSVYAVLYNLVIIYATLFLSKKGGFFVASAAGLLYGLLLDLEYYGILPAYGMGVDYNYSAGYVLSRIFIHFASFYMVAFLVSFVVEQEKKSRVLLTEKEGEFDQLDLLHKSIIEHINAGIMTVDLDGRIKSFNRAAEEISGFQSSRIVDKEIEYVFPGFTKTLEKMHQEENQRKMISREEIVYRNKNKRELVLGFSVSSLMDSNDKLIGSIIIFQDLTATKEMEKEVERSKNLALIGEMAAGLTHEIRNPLTAMSGSIQLLQKRLDLNETDGRLMRIVLRGRDQLEKLVSNFLLLARPNPSERERINIKDLIQDVIESLHKSPDWNRNIKVETTFDAHNIYGNRVELTNVFWNLMLNSMQAMPEGGMLKIWSTITQSDHGENYFKTTITDTGSGIEKDIMSRIFMPFFSTKQSGTGLGLPIVNRILQSHGGEVQIESQLGKGTTCRILFPMTANKP